MFETFQLTAIVEKEVIQLLQIPMHNELQNTLSRNWYQQMVQFSEDINEVAFEAGYIPELNDRFILTEFELPVWLQVQNSNTVHQLDPIDSTDFRQVEIRAIVAFVRLEGEELILFQNFTQSKVLRPGFFLFLKRGIYTTLNKPGLTLNTKLEAIYSQQTQKLQFRRFRTTNTFLPLEAYYREASEHEIRQILYHELLDPQDSEVIIKYGQNQWFRKRFAMLKDSGILDNYNVQDIVNHSLGYEINIAVKDEKIVFPADKAEGKRLLQFLNEELFRGAITETLYETNSKRAAD